MGGCGCGCGCGDSGSVPLRFGEVRGLLEKGCVFDVFFGFGNGDGGAGGSIYVAVVIKMYQNNK